MVNSTTTYDALPGLRFDTSFGKLPEHFFSKVSPTRVKQPKLVKLNDALARELGLDIASLDETEAARVFAGDVAVEDDKLIAMAYSGHQFGHFNPQLGDGRAGLIGEVVTPNGERFDLQLKGSGPTPYSRRGDGRAGIGPVIREYILSEAMHALGVPTTRSLAIATTGEFIFREAVQPGAVLTRVAASHIRIGTFQYFAAKGDDEGIRTLTDYAIERHYPELNGSENRYLALLEKVMERQASLVAKWMSIGFIHGVMNTDNMTISGETIDYGPCAFLDAYDHNRVFSSIDQQGRYAYGAQASIAQWNLARLAETLLPLMDSDETIAIEKAKAAIETFPSLFVKHWKNEMGPKFGMEIESELDKEMVRTFLSLLQKHGADFTNGFRSLSHSIENEDALHQLVEMFQNDEVFDRWHSDWRKRVVSENSNPASIAMSMLAANPAYIPRNHLVEAAIVAAEQSSDFLVMEKLLTVLANPFEEKPEHAAFSLPPTSDQEIHQTFCGT